MRSAFKDWVSETTAYPNEVSEMALGHVISNKVEAAYRRGNLIEKRRQMMAEWDAYLQGQGQEGYPHLSEQGVHMTDIELPRLLRLKHILGDAKANPPIEAIIPISKSSWWNGVKSGKYPKPVKLGENTTVWKETDIRELIDRLS
jgi:predicted DNA-binding transcriptional regulator AlpA